MLNLIKIHFVDYILITNVSYLPDLNEVFLLNLIPYQIVEISYSKKEIWVVKITWRDYHSPRNILWIRN